MGKKIMVLVGSPRKNGNTNTVVDWFVEGAESAGAEVERIDASRLKSKFNGCISCLGCQKSEKFECVVEDEVKPVLARMPEKDVLVFATPVYFIGPSAQIKLVMDRMYSHIKFTDPKTGERSYNLGRLSMALIATGGGDVTHGLNIVDQTFRLVAGFSGRPYSSLLVPSASVFDDSLKQNEELHEKARAFGRSLAV